MPMQMSSRVVMALALLLRAGQVAAQLPTQATSPLPANWTDTIAPFRVIDNVYYVGSAGLTAWLITTPRGHILLDVGLPQNASLVESNIRRLGFRLRDVKFLLNTHAHFDHAGGLAALKRRTHARLIASAGDRVALERGVYLGSEENLAWRFPPVRVDSVVPDGGTVTLGGVTLTANVTPGHTPGCTSWTMPVMADGARHTAIFFCSASVAANRLAPRPQYPGIVDDYRRTFAKFRTMEADVFFAAHSELFDLPGKRARMAPDKPNPFVDAGALQRVVAEYEAEFVKALERQEGAGK
jgi:metallo-beta-lactamase class B